MKVVVRCRRARGLRRRALSGVAIVGVVGAITLWCSGGVAQAAVTNFAMTPDSGPPGTVVHVSGTGSAPGLLASIGTDFVTLTATTFDLAIRVPVTASGTWQASFTVPAGTIGLVPAPVAAVCVSSGIQSLATIYTPQSFSVTTATATTVGTNPVAGGTTSTVAPTPNGGVGPGTKPTSPERPEQPKPTTGPGSTASAPGGHGRGSGGGGGAAGATPGGIGAVTIGTAASLAAKGPTGDGVRVAGAKGHAAAAATLEPADLGALTPANDGSGGLRQLRWLLLLVLTLAVIGVPAWLWHSRRNHTAPGPVGEQP